MALPAQFMKRGPSPGMRAAGHAGGDAETGPGEGVSVGKALDALDKAANSPRAHALLKQLRQELQGDGNGPPAKNQSTPDSPGARAMARAMGG